MVHHVVCASSEWSALKCQMCVWLVAACASGARRGHLGASNSATWHALALNVTRAADCIATLITTFTQ